MDEARVREVVSEAILAVTAKLSRGLSDGTKSNVCSTEDLMDALQSVAEELVAVTV